MQFTELQTERLILRRVRMEDAEAIHAYRSLPEQLRWQPEERHTVEEIRKFLEPHIAAVLGTPDSWLALAITIRDTGQVIGDIGIHFPEKKHYEVELGIAMHPAYHGKGYATEAMRALMGYAFDTLGKHRVYASVDPSNAASIALVERLGFRREGHFLLSVRWKGGWADDLVYGMLESEWRARRKG